MLVPPLRPRGSARGAVVWLAEELGLLGLYVRAQ